MGDMAMLCFRGGLRIMMNLNDIRKPKRNGLADIEIHRKLVGGTEITFYWAWIKTDENQNKFIANILMIENAGEITKYLLRQGTCAAFVTPPPELPRISRPRRQRPNIT